MSNAECMSSMSIWETNSQLKMKLFLWLVLNNRNLTWDNLMRKGKIGPGICFLCLKGGEDNQHLFYKCSYAKKVFQDLGIFFKINFLDIDNTMDFIVWGKSKCLNNRVLSALFHWFIWFSSNKVIFEGLKCSPKETTDNIIFLWEKLRTS